MAFTRRHLPHWIPEEAAIFVTWRLAGSLPLQASPNHGRLTDDKNRSSVPLNFFRQDEQLDSMRSVSDCLQDSRVAGVVANALLYGEKVRQLYELHAWAVMPNHVHAIFQPRAEFATIMRWLKGRTGRVANQILAHTGKPFWQDESFDHWVRSAEELHDLIDYVENNPVKAGLVKAKHQWPWSSATRLV
jgi:REP element-mobilizing transposase RayT